MVGVDGKFSTITLRCLFALQSFTAVIDLYFRCELLGGNMNSIVILRVALVVTTILQIHICTSGLSEGINFKQERVCWKSHA